MFCLYALFLAILVTGVDADQIGLDDRRLLAESVFEDGLDDRHVDAEKICQGADIDHVALLGAQR